MSMTDLLATESWLKWTAFYEVRRAVRYRDWGLFVLNFFSFCSYEQKEKNPPKNYLKKERIFFRCYATRQRLLKNGMSNDGSRGFNENAKL